MVILLPTTYHARSKISWSDMGKCFGLFRKTVLRNFETLLSLGLLLSSFLYLVLTIIDASFISSVQFSSVAQSCPTLCDPMNHTTPGLSVHHQLNEHEFEQASGVGNGQGSLLCFSPWGRKQLDTTKRHKLNLTEQSWIYPLHTI